MAFQFIFRLGGVMRNSLKIVFISHHTDIFELLNKQFVTSQVAYSELEFWLREQQFIHKDCYYLFISDIDQSQIHSLQNVWKYLLNIRHQCIFLCNDRMIENIHLIDSIYHAGVFDIRSDMTILYHLISNAYHLMKEHHNLKSLLFQYQYYTQIAPVPFLVMTSKGQITYMNEKCFEMFAFEKDEMIGRPFDRFVSHDFILEYFEKMKQIPFIKALKFNLSIVNKNEQIRPVEMECNLVYNPNTKEKDILCVIHSISEWSIKDQQQYYLNKKYREIFNSITNIAVQGYSPEGIVLYWNKASENVYGYSQEEAIGRNLFDLIIPENQKWAVKKAIEYMMQNNCSIPAEYLVLKRKDNKPVHLFSSHMVIELPNNQKELYCMDIDISSQKQTEFELEQTKELFASMIKALPDGLLVFNKDLKIIFSSDRMNHLLEITDVSEVLGLPASHFLPEDSIHQLKSQFYQKSFKHSVSTITCKIYKKSMNPFTAEINTIVISDQETKEKSCIALIRDISERSKAEEQIKTLLSEKMLLLKEVHHRIKNNMNTISGLLYLQSESTDIQEVKDALSDARNRVNAMMVIYEKLYRSDDYKYIDVNDYLKKLIHEIIAVFPQHLHTEVEAEADIDKLDSKSLFPIGLILNELITNAFKYAFKETEHPKLSVILKRNEKRQLSITVKDNGPGITDASIVQNTSSFGLSLISQLVAQYKGQFNISQNKGSAFEIVLNI